MVDAVDNNPLLEVMTSVSNHIISLGQTQQTMMRYTVAKDIKDDQKVSSETQKTSSNREYDLKQQGQEVQLTRDGQLIADRNNKVLKRIREGGPLGTETTAEKSMSLLDTLRTANTKLVEILPDGLKENAAVIKERASLALNQQAGLENIFGAIKGDFSLLLGSMNTLQQLPFFNVIKVLFLSLIKGFFSFFGAIGRFLKGEQSLKGQKDIEIIKTAVLKEDESVGDTKNITQDSLIRDEKGRMTSDTLLTRATEDKDRFDRKTQKAIERREKKQNGIRNKFQKGVTKTLGTISRFVMLNALPLILILAGITALAIAVKVFYDDALKFFGLDQETIEKRKTIDEANEEAGTVAITNQGEGQSTFDGGTFFDKDYYTLSDLDMSKIGDATSKQLLTLIEQEGDDLSIDDKIAIDKEIAKRLKEGKGNRGQIYSEKDIEEIQEKRAEMNKLQAEQVELLLEAVPWAVSRGSTDYMGNYTPDETMNYFQNVVQNNTTQVVTDTANHVQSDANVSGTVN